MARRYRSLEGPDYTTWTHKGGDRQICIPWNRFGAASLGIVSDAGIRFSVIVSKVHVSQPHSMMGTIKDLYSLYLVAMRTFLLCCTLFSVTIAAVVAVVM